MAQSQVGEKKRIYHQQQQESQLSYDGRHNYAEISALFQSQAATARNIGALIAHAGGMLYFFALNCYLSNGSAENSTLNEWSASLLLAITGAMNIVAAVIAWTGKVSVNVNLGPSSSFGTSSSSHHQGDTIIEAGGVQSGPMQHRTTVRTSYDSCPCDDSDLCDPLLLIPRAEKDVILNLLSQITGKTEFIKECQ